jgi:hypothetical protein
MHQTQNIGRAAILKSALAVAVAASFTGPVAAAGYPISGTWTYDHSSEKGPASDCSGTQTMSFNDGMRHDTVGSVPELKNTFARQTGPGQYRVLDTFYNGQTWGSVSYTMQIVDQDHVQIDYSKGGSYTLRRCE